MNIEYIVVNKLPETCEECIYFMSSWKGFTKSVYVRCGAKNLEGDVLDCLFSVRFGFTQPNCHNVNGCPLILERETNE